MQDATSFPYETALVTGASSGLGLVLSRLLGAGGVRIAVAARRRAELDRLAGEIAAAGGTAVVLPADLAHPREARRVVAEAQARLGNIDLVIANAGIGGTGALVDLPWEQLEQTMMVNAVASIALVHSALPAMVARQRGWVAGISSLASYRGLNNGGCYPASKAALSTFLETARVEMRPHGVSVTDIHPGFIRTPLTDRHQRRLPFLLEPDHAAGLILRAIVQRRAVYAFPWQMALLLRIVRRLPAGIYDRVLPRFNKR